MACMKWKRQQTDILVKWVPRESRVYLNKILILVYMCLHLAITISFITERPSGWWWQKKLYIEELFYSSRQKEFLLSSYEWDNRKKIDLHYAMWSVLMCNRDFSPKNSLLTSFSQKIIEISQFYLKFNFSMRI